MYMPRSAFLSLTLATLLFLVPLFCQTGTATVAATAISPTGSALPPQAAAAQTYYVATDGIDTIPGGTSAQPWRTLQFAVEHVGPGDTIRVRSGTYVGCRIENSGTADAWITLQAEPGASVLINAPGPRNSHSSNIEVETWEGNGTVAYWIIEGFEVANAPRWGIDLRGNEDSHSHHITVRGNNVHDNGLTTGKTGIFVAFVDDVLVEENESHHNGEHGIYISNSSDRPVIRHNVVHDNANCGIHMNGDAEMGGDGIISDGVVEGNVLYENGTGGGSAINMDGVTGTIARNNLLYRNHAGGIALFQENGAVCSHDNRVLNNTILMPADGRWAINIADSGCTGNHLFNNIIYSDHPWRGSITIPSASLAGFQSDYNVVVDRFSADGDNSTISLSAWQALGYDSHSFIAAPADLFADATADDYHLKAGSPAIDAGTMLIDVTDDLEGNPRPVGAAHDIGAYEFQQAGFLLEVQPERQAIFPGSAATCAVRVTALGGFGSMVSLVAASPSPSLTVELSSSTITPTGQVTLILSDTHEGNMPVGLWYTVPLTATGGGFTQTAQTWLLVGGGRARLPLLYVARSGALQCGDCAQTCGRVGSYQK